MKSKSLKFILIFFVFISIIGTIIKTNVTKEHIITKNNNVFIPLNKSNPLKKQQLEKSEIEKQKQIKQENLEKKWKIGYDQFFKKNYKEAILTEQQVIKEDPKFYKAYAVYGIALAYSGDFNNGMKQIDEALRLKPNYGYARFNKALANELYEHYEEAIKWYKKDLEVETFEWSYYGIASIYGRKSDIKNTIKYLKLSININPNIKIAAKEEEDFDNVRNSMEFKQLMKE